ncbi:MAG: dihydrofolate reductase family protein [Bacteroidetes bacterium]|nr:dihydrofolate reductase family protein [Bacteroidota bacterium]
MRKIIWLMHVSLDGYVAGPNGEMNWIIYDEELRNYVSNKLKTINTVMYGRITYEMMAGYWPKAAANPNASSYDIEHGNWINAAPKIVFSKTMKKAEWNNTMVISENIPEEMNKLKQSDSGKDIVIIGSVDAANYLVKHDLIDEFWIDINPIILGGGKPLFQDSGAMKKLELAGVREFKSGVVGFDYIRKK